MLASMIRWELAYPGSHFFKGDSLRYLQVITAHGLTMIFYVVIPIVFGFIGNFFIPYHIGSKDVAFPRLNSLGFWFLPSGFLLISKPAFIRTVFFKHYDKPSFYYIIINSSKFKKINEKYSLKYKLLKEKDFETTNTVWKPRKKYDYYNFDKISFMPIKISNWLDLVSYPNSF